MKQFIILLLISMHLNTTQCQTLSISKGTGSTETPSLVVKQFKKDYPTQNPTWSKEGFNYRADYTDPATNMMGMVVYDKSGRILRSETELQANSYPGSIGDYYTSTLPNSKYKVFFIKDTTGRESYYSTSNGETFYFDKNGHFKGRVQPKK